MRWLGSGFLLERLLRLVRVMVEGGMVGAIKGFFRRMLFR